MEDGLGVAKTAAQKAASQTVLILVLVEDGLGAEQIRAIFSTDFGLNPCFSGGWSRSVNIKFIGDIQGVS